MSERACWFGTCIDRCRHEIYYRYLDYHHDGKPGQGKKVDYEMGYGQTEDLAYIPNEQAPTLCHI